MPRNAFIHRLSPITEQSISASNAPERFLALKDVLSRLTISRSLLYELIKDQERPFPAPVHIGRRSVWIEREVEDYMRGVIEAERAERPN